MTNRELHVVRIGNSRGIRLPADLLRRYGIGDFVIAEERADGIFLRPSGVAATKLSWEETAREMAAAVEDWREWDVVDADGLADAPWDPRNGDVRQVAEPAAGYSTRRRSKKRS